MARPGYALRIGAETATAVGLIERAFVERGFKLKTAPGALPAELAYGSAGLTFVASVLSENGLPLLAVPSIWKKRKVMKVRILALESASSDCVLRVDVRTFETSEASTSYFVDTVAIAVQQLRAQAVTVGVEGPTDSAAA